MEGIAETAFVVRREQHYDGCGGAESVVKHLADVRRRLPGSCDERAPLKRLEADGSQKIENRPPRGLVSTMHNHHGSRIDLGVGKILPFWQETAGRPRYEVVSHILRSVDRSLPVARATDERDARCSIFPFELGDQMLCRIGRDRDPNPGDLLPGKGLPVDGYRLAPPAGIENPFLDPVTVPIRRNSYRPTYLPLLCRRTDGNVPILLGISHPTTLTAGELLLVLPSTRDQSARSPQVEWDSGTGSTGSGPALNRRLSKPVVDDAGAEWAM